MKKRIPLGKTTKYAGGKDKMANGILSRPIAFPARPIELVGLVRKRARKGFKAVRNVAGVGLPLASNPAYISWLKSESMLAAAHKISRRYSGKASMWHNPYARPRPRGALRQGSVWYTAYPVSHMTEKGESILRSLGTDELWASFQEIGIRALHTGPVKQAGGLVGWKDTGSIDGHFDRISNRIDDLFGTEDEYKKMAETAAAHGAIVIDDIVPGHTGKGADFRLAEMGVGDYPGVYHMVEIDRKDWHLLPDVPRGRDSVNLDEATEKSLKRAGYIIGRLQRVIFYEPGVKETNWSATKAVRGVDGVVRRWVYLHYFKEGQPSLNWIDPSFAGMKLVIGDALHSIGDLGAKGLRLDANGFLGVEVAEGPGDEPAWSEGHPLSRAANQMIASMVRKVGGFTFQEFNLSVDDIKKSSDLGADLSYDFVNRPAYHHALATEDTEFLRMTLRSALDIGVDPASLVHALQNHDELTYELVHYWTVHNQDIYNFRGKRINGAALRDVVRAELREALVENRPYNMVFGENGIACTNVSAIAALQGHVSLQSLDSDQVEMIMQAHLLLAMFNAWQPGVFALSGWDLTGCTTLSATQVEPLLKEGDTRWINRGAYDLLGKNPSRNYSASGMPRTTMLYGDLPTQLADKCSFARRLQAILQLRDSLGIAVAHQVEVPDVTQTALLAMVHELEDGRQQVTVMNFSKHPQGGTILSNVLPAHHTLHDAATDALVAHTNRDGSFAVALDSYQAYCLVVGSRSKQ